MFVEKPYRMMLSAMLGLAMLSGSAAAQGSVNTPVIITGGCNNEQQGRIREAVATARGAVIDSLEDLEQVANGGDTSRIDYWFGSHDPMFVANIRTVFEQIQPLIPAATYTCECHDPTPGVIAAATPNRPDLPIQICPSFFDWDLWEYSTGAIIHEATHLVGVGHFLTGCSPEGSDTWPEEYHELAQKAAPFAAGNAENFRLYALDWHPGGHSTYVCGSENH